MNYKTMLIILMGLLIGFFAYDKWKASVASSLGGKGRQIVVYQDSMHPWIKSDKPGKCTICNMELTPIYEGDEEFAVSSDIVVLSPTNVTVLNVQTEKVKYRPLRRTLRVAGTLEENEKLKSIVAAPVPCRVQDMTVEYTGTEVKSGQKLISIFSSELIQKLGYFRTIGADLGARPTNPIDPDSALGNDFFSGVIVSPRKGVVVERNVFIGQYAAEGDPMLTIVDPAVLWFRFDIYEQQLPWVKLGQKVDMTLDAVPGRVFPVTISFIEPTLADATRTVKVRADVENPRVEVKGYAPQYLLRFGMYAEGRIHAEIPKVLSVPRSAVLFPGGTPSVYVSHGEGGYERREVTLGRQGDTQWEVLTGLKQGENVVTSGNVLIDSEAQFNQSSAYEVATVERDDVENAERTLVKPSPGAATEGAKGLDKQANRPTAAGPADVKDLNKPLTQVQRQVLMDYLVVADKVNHALAVDRFDLLKQDVVKLPIVIQSVMEKFDKTHPLYGLLQRIREVSHWPETPDLAVARQVFPVFSSRVVKLAEILTGSDDYFSAVKIYSSPAPKAGKWFQLGGCLMNPFYGMKQQSRGKEITVSRRQQIAELDAIKEKQLIAAKKGTRAQRLQQRTTRPKTRYQINKVRMALRDDLWLKRSDLIAEASLRKPTALAPLNAAQHDVLNSFFTASDGARQALSSDDLQKFNHYSAILVKKRPVLQMELMPKPRWTMLIRNLPALGEQGPAKDLAEARSWFVPFSKAVVELVKQAKKEDAKFAGLKMYLCPMMPEPGAWMQLQGPIANPFLGPKMLKTGKEIKE